MKTFLRLMTVTVLLSRLTENGKRRVIVRRSDQLPPPASGRELVENLDKFKASPEDWEQLEETLNMPPKGDMIE